MLEDLSIGKILLILLVVVIFFGPKKIPDFAQSIGKGIREFRKAMRDVSDEVQKSVNEEPKVSQPSKVIEPSGQQTMTTSSRSGPEQKS